jgi:hypothetical protein
MFLKIFSIICPFAQIVRGRRRRRLVAPRPGGDFVAPGKNSLLSLIQAEKQVVELCSNHSKGRNFQPNSFLTQFAANQSGIFQKESFRKEFFAKPESFRKESFRGNLSENVFSKTGIFQNGIFQK